MVIKTTEAAKILGVSTFTVRALIREGKYRALLLESDVRAYMASRKPVSWA